MVKKVVLLFGGMSTEHEVSCVSVCGIIENIDREKYEPIPVGITLGGAWVVYDGPAEKIKSCEWEQGIKEKTPADLKDEFAKAMSVIMDSDIVFPVLHGKYGEDGTVQGLLELLHKPYVGCRVLGSSIAMDKVFAKEIAEVNNIPQCEYVWINREEYVKCREEFVKYAGETLGYPCFVKPANSGSSVGIGKANNEEELLAALDNAAKYDRRLLVEEFVEAKEIECAVLGNEKPIAAIPGEIVPSCEFYDYDDKYKLGKSFCVIPADIGNDNLEYVRKLAVKSYKAMDLSGLSRVDFFVKKDGSILLNEINTLPGFTQISMYPKLFENYGISYKELISEIIEYGFAYEELKK